MTYRLIAKETAKHLFGCNNGEEMYENYFLTMSNAADSWIAQFIVSYNELMRRELHKHFDDIKQMAGFRKNKFSEADIKRICYHFLITYKTTQIHKMVYCRDELQNSISFTFSEHHIRDVARICKDMKIEKVVF